MRENRFQLTEQMAEDFIIKWIEDHNFEREKWNEKMQSFVNYFAYRHPDFETYRRCFQSHIFNIGAVPVSDELNR